MAGKKQTRTQSRQINAEDVADAMPADDRRSGRPATRPEASWARTPAEPVQPGNTARRTVTNRSGPRS